LGEEDERGSTSEYLDPNKNQKKLIKNHTDRGGPGEKNKKKGRRGKVKKEKEKATLGGPKATMSVSQKKKEE